MLTTDLAPGMMARKSLQVVYSSREMTCEVVTPRRQGVEEGERRRVAGVPSCSICRRCCIGSHAEGVAGW